MSEQTWYFIDDAGATQGPINIHQLQVLVASKDITSDTQIRADDPADVEQWIPASNIECLFPNTTTAAPALRKSSPVAIIPKLTDTVPMIPSTPTTQPVRGVPVPKPQKTSSKQTSPYQSPSTNPEPINTPPSPKESNSRFWILLFLIIIPLILLAARLYSM